MPLLWRAWLRAWQCRRLQHPCPPWNLLCSEKERPIINVTRFSSIKYWSNNEYWTQKCTQSGHIHSIKLDVYAEKQSASNLSFVSSQHKQGRKCYCWRQEDLKMVVWSIYKIVKSTIFIYPFKVRILVVIYSRIDCFPKNNSQLFCANIFSCSLTLNERIYVDPLLCFIHRDTCSN